MFDLYGTLVRIRRRLLPTAVPRLLGIGAREWMRVVRRDLLTRTFDDRAAFVRFICDRLAPGREEQVRALVDDELASVEAVPGVLSVLAFLRRRGYATGLLSNLSSVHKEPLGRLGLEPLFDAFGFSCDAGMTKPEPRFYRDLCQRLGVAPEEALVVGDSLPNDVVAPRALGMRALAVGAATGGEVVPTAAHVGFRSLRPGSELVPLLPDGLPVTLGGRTGHLHGLAPLPDPEQGRYNLVATAEVVFEGGDAATVYCKRYLFPEGAHVEEFAHRFLRALGLPACEAVVSPGPEPCLIASRAPGAKLEEAATAPVARQVGRQAALAYLFANADLRPRNAFASEEARGPILTMIDLEHCFFDLALDVSGIDDPLRPESLDRLGADEMARRIQRRVLTPRTMKRARRAFFGTDTLPPALERAFEEGWMDAYREVQGQADRACGLIAERLRREPFLVIGTQAYRRAMAGADLDEIKRRLGEDAGTVYAESFGRAAARAS